jgi:hypothetical protein
MCTTESLILVYSTVASTRIVRLSAYIGNEDVHGDRLLRLVRRNLRGGRSAIAVGRVQIDRVRRKGGKESGSIATRRCGLADQEGGAPR